MFCHDSSSLLFSERKNSTIVSTRARKRWERPEGGERAGHRLHHDRICGCHDRGKDGIHLPMGWPIGEHQRCVRRSSLPDTSLPHASPYRLPTILLLAFSLSAVSLWQNQ